MQAGTLQERPAFVRFETRPVEDRTASIEAGCYRAVDVDFALITPAGSKDCVERVVTEWFTQLNVEMDNQRIKPEWVAAYKQAYEFWKQGKEIPVNGTPIMNWGMASPAQQKMLTEMHVRSVEDLAVANEETLRRIGMGAQALKQNAIAFLMSSKDAGKVAAQVTALEAEVAALKLREASLEAQLKEASMQLTALQMSNTPQKPVTTTKL